MAYRTKPLRPIQLIFSSSAFALLLLLTLGTVITLWLHADIGFQLLVSDWAIIKFTIFQALTSATISILIAIPAARALSRRKFKGRQVVLTLMGAPFILPTIVAILGILAVWGRSGYVSEFLQKIGNDPINIYGFYGVVLAHVFFNIPLATRLIVQGWTAIPVEQFRLAAQLGISTSGIGRHIERPMLRTVVPGAFLIIFFMTTEMSFMISFDASFIHNLKSVTTWSFLDLPV